MAAKSGIKGPDQAGRRLTDEKMVRHYNLPHVISTACNNFVLYC